MDIHLKIKDLRNKNSITKKQLSDSLKIDNSQISKIEQGELMPTVDQLIKIAYFFNVSIDSLLEIKLNKKEEKVIDITRAKIQELENKMDLLFGSVSNNHKVIIYNSQRVKELLSDVYDIKNS